MNLIEELVELSAESWRRLRGRVEGLTDEEYFWEPAPRCWTVRRVDDTYRADWGVVIDADPPFTTIAWRVWHLVGVLGAERNARWLGLEPEPLDRTTPPGTADAAIERLERAYELWLGCLNGASVERLAEELGPQGGPYASASKLAFVLHLLDEFIHHAAEVAVLRDLYRATQPLDRLVEALLAGDRDAVESVLASDEGALERLRADRPDLLVELAETGRWDGMRLLLDLGFPVVASSGRSALHHAAAAGALDAVRLLVERGAELDVTDPTWNQTPLGWARYFGQEGVVEYLEPLSSGRPRDRIGT